MAHKFTDRSDVSPRELDELPLHERIDLIRERRRRVKSLTHQQFQDLTSRERRIRFNKLRARSQEDVILDVVEVNDAVRERMLDDWFEIHPGKFKSYHRRHNGEGRYMLYELAEKDRGIFRGLWDVLTD